ncbi:MAG TPA: substrate-binding domain-containing protein [Acidimicrobiales bacterium]|nr:substrate-binding domain-containing protein [Acidimicrobiales bacterium]
MRSTLPKWRAVLAGVAIAAMAATTLVGSASVQAAPALKTGLKVAVIPKNLGNSYFTTADSVKSGGALAALKALGESGVEISGTTDTPASQLPVIQSEITKGVNAIIISGTDPSALCPTLNSAMAKGIVVVTYDSDTNCRDLFIDQASPQGLGDIEVQMIAKEIDAASPSAASGQIAIVSASIDDTNQNTWIGYMKQKLKSYPHLDLVKTVYGNDDTATSTQVTEGLLSEYPNLKGIISPTTVGIAAAAAVLDTAKYRGKVQLTGLGTPDEMKKYVADGTEKEFALWNPADLGYLAAYAAVELASKAITNAAGQSFVAGKLGKYTVGSGHTVLLGLPFVFDKANINQFNF